MTGVRRPARTTLRRQAAKRVRVLLRPARTISWDHCKLAASG